ncbi:lipase 3-like isoform X3 [Bacillus rossius redtenbacheri]|uniref:lipase 3-like isoform X3 n=1 Tax=Bacillus rossius redtenbacheri TaxID=93214 RepID=UPI002FDCA819
MWLNSFIILVLAVMFWRKLSEPLQDKNNEVAFLNTSSLVRRHGYPVETHEVTTADGYRLTLHRIPGGGRPVLLLHGFLQSSASFLLGDPGHSLGYILADAGFDVWLGNWRGNFYSQKHSNKFISRQEFWNFSWHEMGVHDLPAFIDKILHETGRPQLSLVGFSMGAAAFLVLASQKPQYNDKVSASVWVAPAAFLQHTSTSFMGYFFTGAQALQSLLAAVDIFQVLPRYSVWGKLFLMLCANDRVTNSVCTAIYSLIGGHNPSNLNKAGSGSTTTARGTCCTTASRSLPTTTWPGSPRPCPSSTEAPTPSHTLRTWRISTASWLAVSPGICTCSKTTLTWISRVGWMLTGDSILALCRYSIHTSVLRKHINKSH